MSEEDLESSGTDEVSRLQQESSVPTRVESGQVSLREDQCAVETASVLYKVSSLLAVNSAKVGVFMARLRKIVHNDCLLV